MKKFFRHIASSIYGPAHYSDVLSELPRRSFGYFFTLAFFVSLVAGLVGFAWIGPTLTNGIRGVVDGAIGLYPPDLVLTLKGGMLSMNKPSPVRIPCPVSFQPHAEAGAPTAKPCTLVMIDTAQTVPQLNSGEGALIFLGKDVAIVPDKNGTFRLIPFNKIPDGVLTHAVIAQFATTIKPYFFWIPFLPIPGVFIAAFVVFLLQLGYLLFAALLIWLVLKLKGYVVSYGAAYRVGLYAITAPVLVSLLLLVTGLPRPRFVFTVLLLIIVWFNYPKRTNTGLTVAS